MDNRQSSFFSPAPPQPMTKKKSTRVSRGKKLKRHPVRPPTVKRVVATKPVRLASLPDGPIGHIVGSVTEEGQRVVLVEWEGRSKVSRHNPRFLVSVREENNS